MLRLHRHELFNDAFQEELEGMYRATGAGREPLPPAILCMVSLLQAYTGASHAEAVELTVVDARWQMVLDRLGAESPLVSQGALPLFRARLIGAGHAARKIVHIAAKLTGLAVETVAQQARIPLVLAGSTKSGLDRDWSDPEQRSDALEQQTHLDAELTLMDAWALFAESDG